VKFIYNFDDLMIPTLIFMNTEGTREINLILRRYTNEIFVVLRNSYDSRIPTSTFFNRSSEFDIILNLVFRLPSAAGISTIFQLYFPLLFHGARRGGYF
jgi:hypothetical protein